MIQCQIIIQPQLKLMYSYKIETLYTFTHTHTHTFPFFYCFLSFDGERKTGYEGSYFKIYQQSKYITRMTAQSLRYQILREIAETEEPK